MKKKILITLILLPFWLNAQNGTGLWTGIAIEKKLTQKLSVNLNTQVRFADNISYAKTYFGEIGLSYRILKGLEIAGYYRLIDQRKNENKNFKIRQRYYADLSYEKKLGPIKFDYRLRYQYQFKDNDGVAEFEASYLRNKLEISYPNNTKFTPSLSADLFTEIGGKTDQIRPKFGVSYKINKQNSLDFSVFKNVDLINSNSSGPIIGLTYKLKLK
jgi:Protein of unknown function (DUF2490)